MRGWWRGKSTPEKFDVYIRWSFYSFGPMEVALTGAPAVRVLGAGPGGLLLALMCLHAAGLVVLVSRTTDWRLRQRERPVRLLWTFGALTAGITLAAVLIARYRSGGPDVTAAVATVYGIALVLGTGVVALGLRERRQMYAVVGAVPAVLGGLAAALLGTPWPGVLLAALILAVGSGFVAFISVSSIWLIGAVYELDAARETRARLAVAEERLRFGRDLHDVLGRNLAVIALKSELAVQLARRGREEGVEQMIEVQRIARESQREVRAVVRGYREADLGVELAGAQGVLSAAGIVCEVRGADSGQGLPGEVQSALGWVVREATTNVLRHGDAGRCEVRLEVGGGRVVLVVENDGAVEGGGASGSGGSGSGGSGGSGGGSGLAGLRERLAAVDGVLEAGAVSVGVFRVVASVPLDESDYGVREVTS